MGILKNYQEKKRQETLHKQRQILLGSRDGIKADLVGDKSYKKTHPDVVKFNKAVSNHGLKAINKHLEHMDRDPKGYSKQYKDHIATYNAVITEMNSKIKELNAKK